MPKATITLPDGTTVVIDGSPEEVASLLAIYGGDSQPDPGRRKRTARGESKKKAAKKKKPGSVRKNEGDEAPDVAEIVNLVKECDMAEAIETTVLDKIGQVNRILLPLYIVHEHLNNSVGLTSGDISKVTTDLGIPIQVANASRTLSGTASKYVIGDKVRRKGQPVRYKISRRGLKYFGEVLNGA